MIISKKGNSIKSYVGYTVNLEKRINNHNNSKGAKSTRGRFWKIAYQKKFKNKSLALKYEYYLKNNIKLRKEIKNKYVW